VAVLPGSFPDTTAGQGRCAGKRPAGPTAAPAPIPVGFWAPTDLSLMNAAGKVLLACRH